jgi:hypothetical protein
MSEIKTFRPSAARSTYDAFLHELREYGLPQLEKHCCRSRLADLSCEQIRELISALLRLRPKYPATICDALILKLGDQL